MTNDRKVRVGMAAMGLALLSSSCTGATAQTAAASRVLVVSSGSETPQPIREIDDPHSGARWMLLRNSEYPAGPGRLVLAGGPSLSRRDEGTPQRLIIRAGDRLIVEESTPVVEARLEAIALGPAGPGSAFDVRLKIGGRIARVVALAPGRAAFPVQTEARP